MPDEREKLTRRGLFQRFGVRGSAPAPIPAPVSAPSQVPARGAWIAARGREASVATGAVRDTPAVDASAIRLASTENPLGPSEDVVDLVLGAFPAAGRPSSPAQEPALVAAIAGLHGVTPRDVVLGAGSSEILESAVRSFTSAAKPLVTPTLTFESPREAAQKVRTPVRTVPLDAALRVDLDRLVDVSIGAGLVYLCNPNNPTGTVHGAAAVTDFAARVRAASPETVVLVDEAYHDYVIDPACGTMTALAATTPNLVVTRTLSKAYGMAGLRVGYAIGPPPIVQALTRARLPFSMNPPTIAAAIAALEQVDHLAAERARNAGVREFTTRALAEMGFVAAASNANFVFVDLQRPAASFREACRTAGVLVGRDFPPFEQTHCRISIGTMEEMQTAVAVFGRVLAAPPTI